MRTLPLSISMTAALTDTFTTARAACDRGPSVTVALIVFSQSVLKPWKSRCAANRISTMFITERVRYFTTYRT